MKATKNKITRIALRWIWTSFLDSPTCALLARKRTAESSSLNLGSNLTGCSCGKSGVVNSARALSFADVFAISASNFKRDSSCFKRNLLLESLTFFKHVEFGLQYGDFSSRNCDWWGAAATRTCLTWEFETLEALKAVDAFAFQGKAVT